MKNIIFKLYYFAVFCCFTQMLLFPPLSSASGSLRRTMKAYSSIPGISPEQVKSDQEQIKKLDYSSQLVLRALSKLPGVTGADTPRLLSVVSEKNIDFDRASLLAGFCELDEVNLEVALDGLQKISKLDFETLHAAQGIVKLPGLKAGQFFRGIEFLSTLGNSGRWAVASLLQIKGMNAEIAIKAVKIIKELDSQRCWAAEGLNKIKTLTPVQALKNLELVKEINDTDALTIQALGNLPDMTGPEAEQWLSSYFIKPAAEHNALYKALSPARKTTLLRAFNGASSGLVWQINNLHSVSDDSGNEISANTLNSSSIDSLTNLFNRLPEKIRADYGAKFSQATAAGKKSGAITILRQATGAARKYAAACRTTANLYIILSRLTIMYDSSYRFIVAPELKKRVTAEYRGNLLSFLQDIDPESMFVATFITSMAQKRQLGSFWPQDSQGQKDILAMVSCSAFRDHNSLIFFAAGFPRVLKFATPEAAHFLLDKMITLAQDKDTLMAQQVRIILQYYLENQSNLLDDNIQAKIREIMTEYGEVQLAYYARTPFGEWLKDGELHAFSTYNTDDDGFHSFVANTAYLLSKGYQPIMTESFSDFAGVDKKEELARLLKSVAEKEKNSGAGLFRFMRNNPLVVDFVKTVNSVKIFQSMTVFHNNDTQRSLVKYFLQAGYEMLIHRGHSYWLELHLLVPLRELDKSGELAAFTCGDKQRFLSIGSCGATNNFTELRTLFKNHIDIIGSIGTGVTAVNNCYNVFLLETVAQGPEDMDWKEVDRRAAAIMTGQGAQDYLLPGSLPAVLYKIQGAGGKCEFRRND